MTVLLTYPRGRVPADLRERLEKADAVLYLPLRELRAVELDAVQTARIRSAARIVITSRFALRVHLDRYWTPEWPGTLILLSHAMADAARAAGARRILVPHEENQRSLAELLAFQPTAPSFPTSSPVESTSTCLETAGSTEHAVSPCPNTIVLCGNIPLPHDALPASLPRIMIYENVWGETEHHHAIEALRGTTPHQSASEHATPTDHYNRINRIDRILVTSPSAYHRLTPLIARAPERFAPNPTYYTLGPSTAEAIAAGGAAASGPSADGARVITPSIHTDVLHNVIDRIIADIASAQAHTDSPVHDASLTHR